MTGRPPPGRPGIYRGVVSEPRVILVGRPGCHLCDVARQVVAAVAAETGTPWAEVSVLDEEDLLERYAELVPVVLVDGVQHTCLRVDADALRGALCADADGRPAWLRRWSRRPGA